MLEVFAKHVSSSFLSDRCLYRNKYTICYICKMFNFARQNIVIHLTLTSLSWTSTLKTSSHLGEITPPNILVLDTDLFAQFVDNWIVWYPLMMSSSTLYVDEEIIQGSPALEYCKGSENKIRVHNFTLYSLYKYLIE
jgi:hypothetical protein